MTLDSCKERHCQEASYNNTQYCVLHLPSSDKTADFDKAFKKKLHDQNFDFRCVWFPEKTDFSKYPFPSEVTFEHATFNGEADFRFAKFSGEATFRHVRFCAKAYFNSATFEKSVTFRGAIVRDEASFNSAVFKQRTNFKSRFRGKTDFSQTEFRGLAEFSSVRFKKDANFYKATFISIARFDEAVFKQVTNFDQVIFHERVNFNDAEFVEEVTFRGAIFQNRVLFDSVRFKGKANFHLANFKDYVRFKGDEVFFRESPPKFREVKFDHPEMVSFHSVHLRPFWFVEVDATNFVLTNVNWDWELVTIDREVDALRESYRQRPSRHAAYSLLGIACWNLAVNAEENHRYEEASKFRYRAMESRRRATGYRNASRRLGWRKTGANLTGWFSRDRKQQGSATNETDLPRSSWSGSVGILHWLYWILSGYGERIVRALLVLIGIWVVFGAIYALTPLDKNGTPFGWLWALAYSAGVITLQRPDPRPTIPVMQALVIFETILGPVQVALLALAIRRKFMR